MNDYCVQEEFQSTIINQETSVFVMIILIETQICTFNEIIVKIPLCWDCYVFDKSLKLILCLI